MPRESANFLITVAALARMSGLSPDAGQTDLGLEADRLADVLLDWNQGYQDAYEWQNTNWEDAWTSDDLTPDADGLITYTQLQDAAQFALWSADPRTDSRAVPLAYRTSDAGIHLVDWTAPVHAFWKPVCPVYSFQAWNAETTYTAGDVKLASDGQCYIALQGSTNKNPPDNPTEWRALPVLRVLTRAAQKLALANKATRDGEHGEARKLTSDAEELLDNQAALEFPRVSTWWWIRRTQ